MQRGRFDRVSIGEADRVLPEQPPDSVSYFSEDFAQYCLQGRLLHGRSQGEMARSSVFAIHGARSDYTKLDPLLFWLQRQGVGSLSFNLSGHGPSSPVPLFATSLASNVHEAERFYAARALPPRVVLGQSLGGALALKLAERHEESIGKLVLICPAIYPEKGYHYPFGPQFTEAISYPYGFMDSSSLQFLARYAGDVLLVVGEYDGLYATDHGRTAGCSAGVVTVAGASRNSVIPAEVVNAIESVVAPARLHKISLPGCDHGVSNWLREDVIRVDTLGRQILNFIA